MIVWFAANCGTILISMGLIAVVTRIVIGLRRDKESGCHSCGGNCPHCAMNGACHTKK